MSEKALSRLMEFLSIPSISTDKDYEEDMRRCSRWLEREFESMGMMCDPFETGGHPVVLAWTKPVPGKRTVLIYGHYDVQPVDPLSAWDSDPFSPEIRDGKIFARGATDNKGQIYAHMTGVAEALKIQGELPVNIIFLVEGEEEIGSPNLRGFLEANWERLACDIIVVSDTSMVAPGIGTLTYGLRGIAAMEVMVHGPKMDLHSGMYGGAVANPATVAAQLVSTLHDENGSVAIDGFYEGVTELHPWEREQWRNLPFNDAELIRITGVPALAGEAGYSGVERIWTRPTAEVNGLTSGYQGEGTKTVIPSWARIKLTFRLVPGQDTEHVLELAEKHFQKHCPPSVRLEIKKGHAGKPYLFDPKHPDAVAAQAALREVFEGDIALIREGGSIPIVETFQEILGVPTLLAGLALPDCNAHSPNESFLVDNFVKGIQLNQELLRALARK